MLQREATRSGNVLQPEQESDVGVTNGDAFKIIVIPGHQVEQILAAVAVEDYFTITRSLNHDRFVGRPALRQIVRAVEGRAIGGEGCDRNLRSRSDCLYTRRREPG